MTLKLLLGGARSGKSSLALSIAGSLGLPVTFLATAEALDGEMAERIARHRAERAAGWETIEEPVELGSVLARLDPDRAVVLDCLTVWVSNLVLQDVDGDEIVERAAGVAALASGRPGPVVVVSNEVGSGIVPADSLSRRYRDTLGRVNATFAAEAAEAYLVVSGRLLELSRPETSKRVETSKWGRE